MNCTARTQAGGQCSRAGTHFGHLCTQHYNARIQREPGFAAQARAAEQAHAERAAAAPRLVARAPVPARILPRPAAAQDVAAAQRAREELRARMEEMRVRVRAEYVALRTRLLAAVASPSATFIVETANTIMRLWEDVNLEGFDVPKAYVILTRHSIRQDGFDALLTAATHLRVQTGGDGEEAGNYREIPAPAKTAVLTGLATALEPFGPIEIAIADLGPFSHAYTRRVRAIAEAERRRAEEAARVAEAARLAAEEARRLAALHQRLREEPVVFERDPENGINLRAFATDRQSVHRSSVQNATHKSVVALLARALPEGMEALHEIVTVFQHPLAIRWSDPESREIAITELTNDYFNTEAFSIRYGDVVDRVWAFIREHEHRATLQTRLAQEICEGYRMCSNGKMARLVNVLQGFDETLDTEAPKEVFQARIALLMKQPRASREAAARALFVEFNIPEAEHDVWMEPLLEEEEEEVVRTAEAPAAAAAAEEILVVD
jgi:hypothetical protein